MPIFHMRTHVISRTDVKNKYSVVAAAAYRSGQKFVIGGVGMTQSQTFDYTFKRGVVATEVLAPETAPTWVLDRSKLWNAVEAAEKRKDSQLAREVELALPVELERSKQLELVREFAQSEFVKLGMIADICVHDKGDGNPHCHIMLTMRDITKDGFSAKKNRDWNQRDLVTRWRKSWETCVNFALERCGIGEKVSCESLDMQGIDRIPQIHVGAKDARDSGHEARRMRNKNIKAYNIAYAELKAFDVEVGEIEKQIKKLKSAEKQEIVDRNSFVISNLASEILTQEVKKREAYDVVFNKYNEVKKGEPLGLLDFLGFESERHSKWRLELDELRENVLDKWELCGGNRRDKNMGEAEADRRLTLKYALDEAEKILANAEKALIKKEMEERHKQKLEREKVEARAEAKAKDTVVVAEGERVTCHIIDGLGSTMTGVVLKVCDDKVVLQAGKKSFTLKREKVYFTPPLSTQRREEIPIRGRQHFHEQDRGR